MSQVCCVEHCNHSRSKNKCTLKRFPTDTQKCKLWEDIIKREGWERTSWDRICECHFSDEQFEQNRADGLRKLRWDAVPTLFGSNLRVLAKAAAEDVGDKKDSDERLDDNDDLEELEVEIEENSNSDECSDVETYIITGDLSKTIQVIKERELVSTAKNNEKQSVSPPTGKSKTKRIVIRVPSSVGDCSSVLTDEGSEHVDGSDQSGEERILDVFRKEGETTRQELEESRLTQYPLEETRLSEDPLEGTRLIEDPVEETKLIEDPVEETKLIEDPVEETRLTEDAVEETRLTEDAVEVTRLTEDAVEVTSLSEDPAEESRLTEDPIEESELVEDPIEENELVEDPTEESDPTENAGTESKPTEDLGEERIAFDDKLEKDIIYRQWNVQGSCEGEPVMESSARQSDSAETLEESLNAEEGTVVGDETTDMREEVTGGDVGIEMNATILTADARETVCRDDLVTSDERDMLTQTDLSHLKSDWKNPKLKARDVKIMACGGSSKMLFKKRLLQSRASHENDNVSVESKTMDSEEIAEQPVAETLENPDFGDVPKAAVDCAPEAGQGIGYEEGTNSDEGPPTISCESQESSEPRESSVVETSERLGPAYGDVSGAREKDGTADTDDAIVSIEEKLEKIFSSEGENKELAIAQGQPPENVPELTKNAECVQNEDVVTRMADEMTPLDRLEDLGTEEKGEDAGVLTVEAGDGAGSTESQPAEVSSDVDLEKQLTQETDLPSTVEVSEKDHGKGADETEAGSKKVERKPRHKSSTVLKKSPKRKEIPSESNSTEEETTPESKKHEKSQTRLKNRGSKDSLEESRCVSSSKKEHTNHKESNRRPEKENSARKSPEKSRQHNSHSFKDEKVSVAKKTGKTDTEAKKSSDEERFESGKRQARLHSPTKESQRKSTKVSEAEVKSNTKTKDQPKELRSSKRSLVYTAPTRRSKPTKDEVIEEDSEVEEEEYEKPTRKKAKMVEEAVTSAQTKRRGRPPKGKESAAEKAPAEESKSLRYSKRTPKPSEKYRDTQSGRSSRSTEVTSADSEPPRRTTKRKFSSEEEDDAVRKPGRGARAVRRRAFRAVSPVVKRRQEMKNVQDEEDEEEEDAGNAQSICRVCGTEQQILLSIFGPEGSQLRLEDKIHSHLPIRVRHEDKLPLGVCHSCVVTLSACDSLVDKCTQVDKKLRKMFNCPPEEPIGEPDRGRGRKDKARAPLTERAAVPTAAQGKEVAREAVKRPQQAGVVEPISAVVPDAPSVVEPPAEPSAPTPVATIAQTAPVPVAAVTPVPVAAVTQVTPVPVAAVTQATPVPVAAAVVPSVPVEAPAPVVEPVAEEQFELVPMEETTIAPTETRSDPQMVMVNQLGEVIQHSAVLVKKEEYDSEMVSPMRRFGNTYSTGRRTTNRVMEAMDTTMQDRNSVIVIPPAETLRSINNDVPPHSEEYILSMDEPPDDAPKTVIDSILDDWDEDEQASTSAANNRVLTIKNPRDSEIVVTRLYNDEEEILAEGESGEIIIQIQEFSGESREQPFWPAPEPDPETEQETIIPDTDEQQNLTWKCGECGLRGKSVGAFLEHKKGHQVQEKKFFCSLCDQSFASVEMLALHKKEKHYEDDEDDDDDDLPLHARKPKQLAPLDIEEGGFYPGGNCKLYKCAQCDKMFGAAWSWKKHMEAHELDSSLADNRVHKCDVCNQVFFDKPTFEDHKLTHLEGETPFQCSICDAKFATWNVFLTHVHTHKSSKTICKKCGRDFGDVKILRDHVKEAHPVTNDKKFACHLCDKVCRKKIALTEHIRKHTGEMPFECEVCHKRFSRLANYRAHAAIHENQRRFVCEVCGKRFNRQSIQQRHMKTHMRDTIKTSHVCRVCGEAFNKVNELLEHRLNHTRDDVERAYWMDVKLRGDNQDFSCKVCEIRFTTVEAVLLHMPSHSDDERDIALKRKPKAYTCDICHRTLWSKRTFQTHKQWHEQKQFPCTQCDKKYATQTGLNYHMFLHTGERPFQCSFCDKCYKNKNDLRIHVRLHTGEYPYKCKFCPKAFRSPSSLIKHGDAHTEERPFKCGYCDQAFKRENTRANHERIHTNDKRFTCRFCNKGFIQKGACLKHEKWHETADKKNVGGEENPDDNTEDHMEENDSRDTLEIPEPSDSDDSMDFQLNPMEERDVKDVDVDGLSIPAQPSQAILAEPVDEANATAPSSADNNIHITLL